MAGTDGLCAAHRARAPLDAICIAAAIDRSVRCGVPSDAEVQRAEAGRTDAGRRGDMTLVDPARNGTRVRCARTRHVATDAAFGLPLEASDLRDRARAHIRIRCARHKPKIVVFCR